MLRTATAECYFFGTPAGGIIQHFLEHYGQRGDIGWEAVKWKTRQGKKTIMLGDSAGKKGQRCYIINLMNTSVISLFYFFSDYPKQKISTVIVLHSKAYVSFRSHMMIVRINKCLHYYFHWG